MMTNRELEARLSADTGEEERVRVQRATRHAEETRSERDRCLGICALYPDNLMADEIARLIRGGK